MVLALILAAFYILSDFYYWIKWVAAYCALRFRRITHRKRFDLYDYEALNQAEKLSILVPEVERILETPLSEEQLLEAADEIFFYGVSSKSESLVVRIARSCNEEAEAWIYLKLNDGRMYQLQETSGYQRCFGDKCQIFSCGGLQMYYMSPMRKWRIVYCGMLREKKPGGKLEEYEVFVKFTFIWSASSEVYDSTSDVNIKATADAMAKAKWTMLYPPIDKMEEILNLYSQSGVIKGIVSIEDYPDAEMYLFGERIRYLGKISSEVGCKFRNILGVTPQNGLMLHVGNSSVPNAFQNLSLGFIVHPNDKLHAVEKELIISKLSETSTEINNLTVTFKAGKQYELKGNTTDVISFKTGQSWSGHFELREIIFEVGPCKGSGFMLSGEISNKVEKEVRRIHPLNPNCKPLTVSFTDRVSHVLEVSGGKGSSLGRLTELSSKLKSFIVPKGIIVTTAAYSECLTPEIIEKIENLKDIAYGNTERDTQEACKIVSTAFKQAYLLAKVKTEIEEKLYTLFDGDINQHKFAIRSSATGEDTDQMSAAGQMDTFLGVQGMEEIFRAVKKCWASQFGYIAVEYKRQNGQILNSPMAVVIQEMVDCESAGVLFTCDPVTNNPSVIVITGNYGLGESVVSGTEEPDTIILKRSMNNAVELKSVTVGLKEHKIVMADANNSNGETTVVQEVQEDKRKECCISNEMAEKLGGLSLKIEDYYKSPRDIEWGIRNGRIYILQSRPVTTGVTVSDYEITHEFDGPLRCEGDYFTTCNIGVGSIASWEYLKRNISTLLENNLAAEKDVHNLEALPGALTPLGLDVVCKYMSAAFQKKEIAQIQGTTDQKVNYYSASMTSFYNHMMLLVDHMMRMVDSNNILGRSIMIAVFGRELHEPDLKTLVEYKEWKPAKKSVSFIFRFFWNMFFSGSGIDSLKEKFFSYKFPVEKCRTSMETFDTLMGICSHQIEPFVKHIDNSVKSSLWNLFMFVVLGQANGSIDTEVYSDFARLLASTSSVESADVPSAVQNLAYSIAQDMESEVFKSMSLEQYLVRITYQPHKDGFIQKKPKEEVLTGVTITDAKKWLENSTTNAGYKYRQFMKRHGHRCLKECSICAVTWNMDPKPLIKLLQNLSGSCTDSKQKKEEDFSKILSDLKVPLNFKSRLLLKFILPNCRRGVRDREACKSITVKAMDNIRKGYRHLGKKMMAEGFLPDIDLLFFLTINEIQELLRSRNSKFITRAKHRRKLHPALDSMLFPDISKGEPVPINMDKNEDEVYVTNLTMKGIPVSQGTVKGYARVALSLEEAAHLQPGEILITYGTDIGWSPYFPILSGVVTELGGLISHGAVVSREYGLPCVAGLHGAIRKFVTGDYVLLDGNKGILQRLSRPEE